MLDYKDLEWGNISMSIDGVNVISVPRTNHQVIHEFETVLKVAKKDVMNAYREAYKALLNEPTDLINVEPFSVGCSDNLPLIENQKEIHIVVGDGEPNCMAVSRELYNKLINSSNIFITVNQDSPGTYFEEDGKITLNL